MRFQIGILHHKKLSRPNSARPYAHLPGHITAIPLQHLVLLQPDDIDPVLQQSNDPLQGVLLQKAEGRGVMRGDARGSWYVMPGTTTNTIFKPGSTSRQNFICGGGAAEVEPTLPPPHPHPSTELP